MAAVEVTISGVLFDKFNRTSQQVVLIGEAMLTGVGVGGGPIIPGPIQPPGGGGFPPHPEHPILPRPEHPIVLPPIPVPPNTPNVPPPGSPPVIVGGTQPVNPMTPPSAVVIEYPGIGKVVVPQPVQQATGPIPGA